MTTEAGPLVTIIDTADYVRPTTAARLAGLSRPRIHQLIQDGSLPAVQIDGHWYVHRRDVQRAAPPAVADPQAAPTRRGGAVTVSGKSRSRSTRDKGGSRRRGP